MSNYDTQEKDSVDLICDSLVSIQVKQPWLLLQYGSTDMQSIGSERVEPLLSTIPYWEEFSFYSCSILVYPSLYSY